MRDLGTFPSLRRQVSFAHQAEIKSEILSFPYALQRVLQGGVSTWFI
jgi:hypothetical protein